MTKWFLLWCFTLTSAFAAAPLGFDSIRLPQGYSFEHGIGIDSYCGTIHKNAGLSISVDSGIGANPLRSEDANKYAWFRELQIGGFPVNVAMDTSNSKKALRFYYPSFGVSFYAEIQSEADIAEVCSILSTYKPSLK